MMIPLFLGYKLRIEKGAIHSLLQFAQMSDKALLDYGVWRAWLGVLLDTWRWWDPQGNNQCRVGV
ncbi:hypothetical protein HanXRQr2_Chr08g0335741 [Helianthus annuus]|uniref:Uncharacterized protein n=1 Tax=Helianthus annuus TaxID=4232 RepID=A0A9K3ND43_HELAN|nr:hypothetical protein HanXRQr2_Chr08g0335741 [Helianthus annuus]